MNSNSNSNSNSNIFIPSFELERKIQGLTNSLWGISAITSLFAIFLIGIPIYLFIFDYLGLVSAFIYDNLVIIMIIIITILGILALKGIHSFFDIILSSYKFENNVIVKGTIKVDKYELKEISKNYFDKNFKSSINLLFGITSIFSLKYLSLLSTLSLGKMFKIFDGVLLNINQDFVNKYFDTNIYTKKYYNNPKLFKETKFAYIYICDDNNKISIPKVYKGLTVNILSSREISISSRVLRMSLIIFSIFILFFVGDLSIHYRYNSLYTSNINNIYFSLETNLALYGYNPTKLNERCYEFSKIVSSDRTSSLKYFFDRNGNIKDVDVDIYFDASVNINNELKYILNSFYGDSSSNLIQNFLTSIDSCLESNCTQIKQELGDDIYILGSSSGFRHIHN